MQALKCTSRSMFFFSLLLSAFICYSNQSTLILFGPSRKPKSGALTRTGSISTPHPLPALWGTWEPCLVWVWQWTLSCSLRAARGRTATKPALNSCVSQQLLHPCKCMTLLKCPRTLIFCFTFCHFARVHQFPSVWLLLFLTVFISWSEMKKGSWFRL